jgi:hypothetical protein
MGIYMEVRGLGASGLCRGCRAVKKIPRGVGVGKLKLAAADGVVNRSKI